MNSCTARNRALRSANPGEWKGTLVEVRARCRKTKGWSLGVWNSVRTETNSLMFPTLKSEVCFCLLFPFCLVCKLIWSIIIFVCKEGGSKMLQKSLQSFADNSSSHLECVLCAGHCSFHSLTWFSSLGTCITTSWTACDLVGLGTARQPAF